MYKSFMLSFSAYCWIFLAFFLIVEESSCWAGSFTVTETRPMEYTFLDAGTQEFRITVSYWLIVDGYITLSAGTNSTIKPLEAGSGTVTLILSTEIPQIFSGRQFDLELTLMEGNNFVDSTNVVYNIRVENSPTATIPKGSSTPTVTPTPTHFSITPSQLVSIDLPGIPAGAKHLEMVLIPKGTYVQGRVNSSDPNLLSHSVTLTNDFYLGKYTVTQAQWKAVMGNNPSVESEEARISGTFGVGDNFPVYYISWNDCQQFISKLNGLGLGKFRLPTEAEWEYACRAGTNTLYFWGDNQDASTFNQYAWYIGNSNPNGMKEVGLKLPNPWGLCDMTGNEWEWCEDWIASYPLGSVTDPIGKNVSVEFGEKKVVRGGYWGHNPDQMTSDNRGFYPINNRNPYTGVRLVRDNSPLTSSPTPTPTLTQTPTGKPTPVSADTFIISVTNSIGPSTFLLTVGIQENATDSYDPVVDVLAPPADPSGREAYSMLGTGEKLWTDLRGLNTSNLKWNFVFSIPPNQIMTLSWNSNDLPENTILYPVDALGRPDGKSIDMKSQTTIVMAAQGGFAARKLYYVLSVEQMTPVTLPYELVKGWNLISVPLRLEEGITPSSILGALTPIWSYNTDISQYEKPSRFEMHKGYWVYSTMNRTFEITGFQENNLPAQLKPVWNLIGVNQEVLRSTEGIGVVWGFDNQTKKYVPIAPTEYLKPQKGYWFQVNSPVDLFSESGAGKSRARNSSAMVQSIQNPMHLIVLTPSIGDAPLASLELGVDVEAQNGIGTEDYMAPPSVPDAQGNAFFLTWNGSDYVRTVRDVRTVGENQEWILQVDQKIGIPASLTWDLNAFSSLSSVDLVELDPITQAALAGTDTNMKEMGLLQLSAPAMDTSRYFRIRFTGVLAVTEWSIH